MVRARATMCGGVPERVLLHDEDVAVGVAKQERRDGAEQRVLDAREAACSAKYEVRLNDVEQLLLEGLANATGLYLNLDLRDVVVRLRLGNEGLDGLAECLVHAGNEV